MSSNGFGLPGVAAAANLQELASRPLLGGGESSASASAMNIMGAQQEVAKLLADEETYRKMVSIGLPTSSIPMPPSLSFALFKRLEPLVADPGTFMDAAIEYVEYARE